MLLSRHTRRREFITLLGSAAAAWPLAVRAHSVGLRGARSCLKGEGRSERFTEIVAEFVQLKVEVIMTYGTPAIIAAKQATSTIPIIFAAANNPIGSGLVASLVQPGARDAGGVARSYAVDATTIGRLQI
jgi:putative ABC transport system substrate-binding protein